MIFAKKKRKSYVEATEDESEYIILDIKEYENLNARIRSLERERSQFSIEMSKLKHEYEYELRNFKQKEYLDNENRKIEYEKKLEKLKEELQEKEKMNEGLKRINRERSNSDRRLRPKKKHCGYLVLNTRKIKDGYITLIETPYNCSCAENMAERLILEDIKAPGGVLSQLGLITYNCEEMNQVMRGRTRIEMNFKRDYWQISIMHTKMLESIPPELNPRNYK